MDAKYKYLYTMFSGPCRSPERAVAEVPDAYVPHVGVENNVAEVQRVLLREERAALPERDNLRNVGHHLHVAGFVFSNAEKILVDGLRNFEVLLHVLLPLVLRTSEHDVLEDFEEELFPVLF